MTYMRSQEYKVCYEGKDGSPLPNVAQCQEPGVCYKLANGTVYPGYQGRQIVIEEWFHTMHAMGIQSVDPEGYAMIHANAVRLHKAGIWMSRTTKGHGHDRYR